ncbi:hypothetical protein ACOQFV_08420 [Nocardiopsis changdeensis]|uniref:Uncharacterized protein n=1 Tax=Nocardiopsis changdeensis TaxID=2831969 RepID=A0ABX8BHJ5_9ACTN|nr:MULTISPECIES: hypothetical protein [Nocardiopsis]QUX20421.1 hypothetical protein KGD84_18060 [Nocardiopsis changdeensis]QYX36351.1 hypothetical protein K1J57_27515 [Nocardiopsis sp. MT53]
MDAGKILLAHNVTAVAALAVVLVGSLSTGIIWWVWAAMGLIVVVTIGLNIAYSRGR